MNTENSKIPALDPSQPCLSKKRKKIGFYYSISAHDNEAVTIPAA